jgi:hypothetical protein
MSRLDDELELPPGAGAAVAMRMQALADLAERFSQQLRYEAAVWRQPSGTGDDGPEIAIYSGKILLRSRRQPQQVVELTREEWKCMVEAVMSGEFGPG